MNAMIKKMIMAGLIVCLLNGQAVSASQSDGADEKLKKVKVDETLVTARGVESQISQTPGGTAVMEGQSLYVAQDPSITNTMAKIPGVDKSSDSAWGSAVNIRGLGRSRVVFLIDGCRVNTATDVNAQFGFINPNEIERIEILKGPVSALYGSGAMGGVVNVITKKGLFSKTPNTKTTLGGSYASNPQGYSAFTDTMVNSQNFWVYGFGGKRDYDSYENGDGDTQSNSQFEDYNASLKAGYKWNDQNSTDINIQYLKGSDIGIPGKGLALPTGPEISYPETDRTLISLVHRFLPQNTPLAESDLNIYYQEIDRNVTIDFPQGAPMKSIKPSANHKTWGAKWKNAFDFDTHGLVAGLDIWSWEIESIREKNLANGKTGIDTPLADAKQISAGFFLEDDIELGQNFVLNMGGRIDYIKAESDELYNWITPPVPAIAKVLKRDSMDDDDMSWDAHAGITWNLSSSWSMTMLGAFSYRAPDLMDRYKYIAFAGGETYGNPDLDPERSSFIEYGLHYRTSKFSFSTSLYDNHLKDMIAQKLKDADKNIYQMENINKARIYGGEIDARFFTGSWELYGNIAYTRGTDETSDTDLSFIPPLNGLVGVAYNMSQKGFWADCNLIFADEQDKIAPGGVETSSWETINAKGGYRFSIGEYDHDFMVGVDNLLDEQYSNHLSTSRGVLLAEPGINIYAAWKVSF